MSAAVWRGGFVRVLAGTLLLGLTPLGARAQDPPAPAKAPRAERREAPPGKLEWKGRVFARAAYEETSLSSAGTEARSERLRLTLPSARVGFKYQALAWLSLVAEADLTDRPLVRDAFVQARSRRLRARAGQFKMPLSAITLESPWVLPVARRGIIQDVLEERMSLVGRRPGFLFSVEGGGSFDPELSLSAFQGAFLVGDATDTDVELLESGVDAQNLVARFAVTPGGQELALHGERISTAGFMGQRRHFWAGGADATLDEPFGLPGLRAWLEAVVGQTFYIDALSSRDGTYASARAILAWRWGGREDQARYLEPYLMVGYLDPDLDGSRDDLRELFLGLNLGLWRTLRLTLQLEKARAGDQLPGQLFFVVNVEDWWDPHRLRFDERAGRLEAGARYQETYAEYKRDRGGLPVMTAVSTSWEVEAAGKTVVVPIPGAAAKTYPDCVRVSHSLGTPGARKQFWFCRGVGKVKETGGQTEELIDHMVVWP